MWVGSDGGAAEGGASPPTRCDRKIEKDIYKKKTRKNNMHNNPHHARDICICSYFAKNLLNAHDINTRDPTIIKVKD